MNRDFKGVWIPKEIWLNEELTLLEKIIFIEIDSLDNEDHCIAGNEYFATFCNCSESKVSKAIKKLKELNMVEELSFDGRHRKLRVVKSIIQDSKKCYAESQNLHSNNIDNNTTNKTKVVSKDTTTEFQFGNKKQTLKKDNLFTKCVTLVDDFVDTHNCGNSVRRKLISYLNFRLSVKDKPLYSNMWKGMLSKLANLCDNDIEMYEAVIMQSIEKGYLSFYPPHTYKTELKDKPWENGVKSEGYTEEEKRQIEKEREEMIARGERVWY